MTEKFEVIFYGDVINCVRDETGKEYNLHETITILNEQQSTITHLEKVNGKNFAKRRLLEQDNLVLRNENEQLKKELKWKREEIKALIEESERDE